MRLFDKTSNTALVYCVGKRNENHFLLLDMLENAHSFYKGGQQHILYLAELADDFRKKFSSLSEIGRPCEKSAGRGQILRDLQRQYRDIDQKAREIWPAQPILQPTILVSDRLLGRVMVIELNWLTGTPKQADLYFVAVELGTYVGNYDLASWDGEKWDHAYPENIIGYVHFTDLKNKLQLNWPKPEPALPKIEIKEEHRGGWEEV